MLQLDTVFFSFFFFLRAAAVCCFFFFSFDLIFLFFFSLSPSLFLFLLSSFSPKQEFKASDFGWHKTKIAQMLTIKREREIEQGISKRDSRAAEKRAKVEAGFGQF